MSTALLREVADTFDQAIVSHGKRVPDVARARQQHERYAQALGAAGYDMEVIAADERHPDCVFIEDTAVIIGSTAVATRPGASERRGEIQPVIDRLAANLAVTRIEEPATLDGGDVMVIGDRIFAGRSQRTNGDGIAQLGRVAEAQGLTVTEVPVNGVLHLKSGVLSIDDLTVVVTPGTVDESLLAGLRIIPEMSHERHAFSALPLGNGEVLVTAGAPDTAAALTSLGYSVVPIDVSEIQAADGGLTCMSILFEDGPS